MRNYFRNLYKALIGKTHNNQINLLLNYITTFSDKFSAGILRLESNGSGSFYNASSTGIYAKKEIEFKNIEELKRLIDV